MGSSISVEHTEFVSKVYSASDFTLIPVSLQPKYFPWAHPLSKLYETWKPVSFKMTFVSSAATTQNGMVAMAYEYDPGDAPPSDEIVMQQYDGVAVGTTWRDLSCSLDPKRTKRLGDYLNDTTQPLAFQTPAVGYLSTFGSTNPGVLIGQLFITYRYIFNSPQSSPSSTTAIATLSQPSAQTDRSQRPFLFTGASKNPANQANNIFGRFGASLLSPSDDAVIGTVADPNDLNSQVTIGFSQAGLYRVSFRVRLLLCGTGSTAETLVASPQEDNLGQANLAIAAQSPYTTLASGFRGLLTAYDGGAPIPEEGVLISVDSISVVVGSDPVWYGAILSYDAIHRVPGRMTCRFGSFSAAINGSTRLVDWMSFVCSAPSESTEYLVPIRSALTVDRVSQAIPTLY